MLRTTVLALAATLTLISVIPHVAVALNCAGDANNDGLVTFTDAALIQSGILGITPAMSISPLALTGADTALDLDDLLFAAQAAGLVRTDLTPPPGMLSILVPPVPLEVASEQTPNPVISFAVVSTFPDAGNMNGLEIGAFTILEAVESTLTGPDASVQSNIASVEIIPLNTGVGDDNFTVRLTLPIHDSGGALLETLISDFPVIVRAAACGDGTLQTGETCDDGDNDPCTPLCNTGCTGPGIQPRCGDGMIQCGEECEIAMGGDPVLLATYDTMGTAVDIQALGDRAYVAAGDYGLYILDISADTPELVDWVDTNDYAGDVNVAGQTAYIADNDTLAMIDVSESVSPYIAGEYNALNAWSSTIVGDRLYLVDYVHLKLLHVTDTSATLLGQTLLTGLGTDIEVSGSRAFVTQAGAADDGLTVFDIGTDSPVLLGYAGTPGDAHGLAIQGDRAYVACEAGLWIFNLSADTPLMVGSSTIPVGARDVMVDGNLAFVAGARIDQSGMYIFDISTDTPILLTSYATTLGVDSVAVQGTRAYIANREDGVKVLDMGVTCMPGCIRAVCGDGILYPNAGEECDDGNTDNGDGCEADCKYTAYLCGNGVIEPGEDCDDGNEEDCDGCKGDCSRLDNVCNDGIVECAESCDMGAPPFTVLQSRTMDYWNRSIHAHGHRAFLAETGFGLIEIDLDDPSYPTLASRALSGAPKQIEFYGNRAFVSSYLGGMHIVDISEPSLPILDSYVTPDAIEHVTVKDGRGYLSLRYFGLQIIDVDNSLLPQLGRVDTSGIVMHSRVAGDRLFAADGFSNQLLVIDIADPAFPIVASRNLGGFVYGMNIIDNNLGYVSAQQPTYPWVAVLEIDTPGFPSVPHNLPPENMIPADRYGRRLLTVGWEGYQILDMDHPDYTKIAARYYPEAKDAEIYGNRALITSRTGFEVIDLTEPCGPQCTTPSCGDGVINPGEACDDGNTADCDGCLGDCSGLDNICGDGILECDETCDDGNLIDDDGCNSFCTGP